MTDRHVELLSKAIERSLCCSGPNYPVDEVANIEGLICKVDLECGDIVVNDTINHTFDSFLFDSLQPLLDKALLDGDCFNVELQVTKNYYSRTVEVVSNAFTLTTSGQVVDRSQLRFDKHTQWTQYLQMVKGEVALQQHDTPLKGWVMIAIEIAKRQSEREQWGPPHGYCKFATFEEARRQVGVERRALMFAQIGMRETAPPSAS